MFKDKRYQETAGILLILLSILIVLSLVSFNQNDYTTQNVNKASNLIGIFGSFLSYYLRILFGLSSYIFAVISAIAGYRLIRDTTSNLAETIFSFILLIIAASAMIAFISDRGFLFSGGLLGFYSAKFCKYTLGNTGAFLILLIFNLICLILIGIVSITGTFDFLNKNIGVKISNFFSKRFRGIKDKYIPLNSIDEDLHTSDYKLPWIIKKRIRLHNGNIEPGVEKNNQIKYLQMPDTIGFPDGNSDSIVHKESFILSEKKSPIASAEIFGYNDEDIIIVQTGFNGIDINDFQQNENEEISVFHEDFINPEQELAYVTVPNIKIIEDQDVSESVSSLYEAPVNRKRVMDDYPAASLKSEINNVIDNVSEYTIPFDFLNSTIHIDQENWKIEIKKNSELLVNTLADFGIESKVINVSRGPVITLYEIQIAPGIKVNKIAGLADDIAMALAALRVRIVAPIPGKSAIGVEIPNKERENVTLGDVIKSKEYQKQTGLLKVGLGKDILGNPITLDIRRLPHLLIAGATGSGKSVCVNSIITSLMYNYKPEYLRFLLIDPKMVELQIYNGSPHLLTPVITESLKAQTALKWVLFEMDRRYRLLSEKNCRDIEKYNHINNFDGNIDEKLPYIITIIDELADLMMSSTKEIEGYITRIAQKARAVGIHLVLATQRPSVDVITGVIKANFPARIAFQVAQKTDSRTILDQNGAEKLLGKGDMLYQSPMCSFPIRIQGSYLSEDEIIKIVSFLRTICPTSYIDIEGYVQEEEEMILDEADGDELFNEALKIVEETRKASASYLQRRLSIGYNRAARIIEMMEEKGYIGPQHGSKPREVFL